MPNTGSGDGNGILLLLGLVGVALLGAGLVMTRRTRQA